MPTSFMEREIRRQPTDIAALVDRHAQFVSTELRSAPVQASTHLVFAARGTSDHAAHYAKYVLGWMHGLTVALAAPSLMTVYGRQQRYGDALVVGISQSGQSPDVVSVVRSAADQGRPTVAITNDVTSPLARTADLTIGLGQPDEMSVAATTTYTSSLVAVAMLAVGLRPTGHAWLRELKALASHVERAVDAAFRTISGDELGDARHVVVVGRGFNYATALEAALKLRETNGLLAEAFSPPDLLHGPIAAISEATTVVLVAPADAASDSIRGLVPMIRARGGRIVAITPDPNLLGVADAPIALGDRSPPWLTPVTSIVAGQVLALRAAKCRGLDPDRPDGLTKVTRTY